MNSAFFDLIIRTGWMGRLIVALLVIVSFVTWAIIFNRFYVFWKINAANRRFRKRYPELKKIIDIESEQNVFKDSPMLQLGKAGAIEYRRIVEDAQGHSGVKDWSFFLQNQFSISSEHIESVYIAVTSPFDKGLVFLAMTSAIAPFLGLLGTVWGIMISFFDIGNQGSASLPVVAPGIAQALITTIMGLAVAIPALFFYNYFLNTADHIEDAMDEFKEMLLARLKREIFNLLFADKPASRTTSTAPRG
jgi:biopolymer transport protein TolQ